MQSSFETSGCQPRDCDRCNASIMASEALNYFEPTPCTSSTAEAEAGSTTRRLAQATLQRLSDLIRSAMAAALPALARPQTANTGEVLRPLQGLCCHDADIRADLTGTAVQCCGSTPAH